MFQTKILYNAPKNFTYKSDMLTFVHHIFVDKDLNFVGHEI